VLRETYKKQQPLGVGERLACDPHVSVVSSDAGSRYRHHGLLDSRFGRGVGLVCQRSAWLQSPCAIASSDRSYSAATSISWAPVCSGGCTLARVEPRAISNVGASARNHTPLRTP